MKNQYAPPAIVEEHEGLPSYTRAYSNTCSFLTESCARQFFDAHRLRKQRRKPDGQTMQTISPNPGGAA